MELVSSVYSSVASFFLSVFFSSYASRFRLLAVFTCVVFIFHVLPSHLLWVVSKRSRRDRAATTPPSMSCSEGYVPGAPIPCNTQKVAVADRKGSLRSAALTAAKGSHCALLGHDTVQPGTIFFNSQRYFSSATCSHQKGKWALPGKVKSGKLLYRMDGARISKARQRYPIVKLYLRWIARRTQVTRIEKKIISTHFYRDV